MSELSKRKPYAIGVPDNLNQTLSGFHAVQRERPQKHRTRPARFEEVEAARAARKKIRNRRHGRPKGR